MRADHVRKIFKDHGSIKSETARGQRAITANDFTLIPDVISEPEKIKKSTYNNRPAAEFIKVIDGSRVTVIAVDSGGSLDLYVQTMYASAKKGSIARMVNANALTKTPETTTGTAPNTNIPTTNKNVNKKFSMEAPIEDSNGRRLTNAQREFFKDSKAIDSNGRLLTLYHGTGAKFTVFDKAHIGENFGNRGGDLGFYFSPYI